VKAVFRWAVENELVTPDVYHGLQAVKGLQRGRTNAKECLPVKPVPEELINGIKPFVSRQVWALIQLQLFTGARPGELVGLRGIDLKTGSETWSVEPEGHKTAHHGHTRRILFGPQAQAVLQVFLQDRPLDAHLFSPIEAEAERREQQHAARRTPLSCGNRPGTNRRQSPRRRPSQCYDVTSYRHAIWRACDDAFPPPDHLVRLKVKGKRGHRRETRAEWQARLGPDAWREQLAWQRAHRWHPHQLRHNAGTHIRKEFGIELARIILGQRSLSVTEIYAEVDEQKAKDVIRQIG
jgi:integrase